MRFGFEKILLGILFVTLTAVALADEAEKPKPGTLVYSEKFGVGELLQMKPFVAVKFEAESKARALFNKNERLAFNVPSLKWGKRLIQPGQHWPDEATKRGSVKRLFTTEFHEDFVQIEVPGPTGPQDEMVSLNRLPPPSLMPGSLEYPEDPYDTSGYDSGFIQDPDDSEEMQTNLAQRLLRERRLEATRERMRLYEAIAGLKTEAQSIAESERKGEEENYARYHSSRFTDMEALVDEIQAEIQLHPNVVIDLIYDPEKSGAEFLDVLKIVDYLNRTSELKATGNASIYFSSDVFNWDGPGSVLPSLHLTHAAVCDTLYDAVAP